MDSGDQARRYVFDRLGPKAKQEAIPDRESDVWRQDLASSSRQSCSYELEEGEINCEPPGKVEGKLREGGVGRQLDLASSSRQSFSYDVEEGEISCESPGEDEDKLREGSYVGERRKGDKHVPYGETKTDQRRQSSGARRGSAERMDAPLSSSRKRNYSEVKRGGIDDGVRGNIKSSPGEEEDKLRKGSYVGERRKDNKDGDTKTDQRRQSLGSRRGSAGRMDAPLSSSRKRDYSEVKRGEIDCSDRGNNFTWGIEIAEKRKRGYGDGPMVDSPTGQTCQWLGAPQSDTFEANRRGMTQGDSKGTRRATSRESRSENQVGNEEAVDDLKRLAQRDTGKEIAVWMVSRPEALKTLLGMTAMDNDETEKLAGVLAKACIETAHFEGLLKIILDMVADSTFFRNHLDDWIMKVSFTDETEETVSDICTICTSILKQFPNKCVSVAKTVALLYANYASHHRMSDNAASEETLLRIQNLNSKIKSTQQTIQNPKAIDQFRYISIFPEPDEVRINVRPTLKQNLKQGKYANVDVYLNTQFRLLREDFLAPLRAGICSFIRQQDTRQAAGKLDDVRVYRNVRIKEPVCGSDGILHRMLFSLQGWNPRRLESKKILRHGSLVCLSSDRFDSLRYALVINNDDLTQGVVDIMFQKPPTDDDIYDHEYVMVESEAFFEAYRHVLKRLQEITDQTLPLQNYIINVSDRAEAPRYLQENPDIKYDLQSLFKPGRIVRIACISPSYSPTTPPSCSPTHSSREQSLANFPSTHESTQVDNHSNHRYQPPAEVQSPRTTDKQLILRIVGELEVTAVDGTSGTDDELLMVGENEVRPLEGTACTLGEMEMALTNVDETSVTSEEEVTASDALADVVGEGKVGETESKSASTFDEMEVHTGEEVMASQVLPIKDEKKVATLETTQVDNHSPHSNPSPAEVQFPVTNDKDVTDNLCTVGESEVTAVDGTSEIDDELPMVGENEVRPLEGTACTLGEMEMALSNVDETSVTGEKEVTASYALPDVVGEGKVGETESKSASTFDEMEVHTGEEVMASQVLPIKDEKKVATVKARKSVHPCPSDPSMIQLLRFDKWPSESVLVLDESQRRAVHAALTQEFAVIQGPPGTGKTYVGLKIVKVLIENYKVWSRENKGSILVVCYTNHALDQFLEGVADFEDNIVRVGSRSKSEKLERYNLKNRKSRTFRYRENFPNIDKVRVQETQKKTKSEIENKVQNAYSIQTSVVSVEKLQCVMNPTHRSSNLLNRGSNDVGIMTKWLDLETFTKAYSCIRFPPKTTSREKGSCENFENTSDDGMIDHTEEFVLEKYQKYAEKEENDYNKQMAIEAFKSIEQKMQSSERMGQEEVDNVRYVWDLNLEDRWRLYRYWVDVYRSHCLASTNKLIDKYNWYSQAIKDMENDEVYQMLTNVKVIGMTTTCAAKWQSVLQRVGPRIIVVEEAAEVMEAHVITTLSQHCQHLILIGDHQQLKPKTTVYRLAKDYNLDVSLFERMVNNNFPLQTLARQHRMRPEIAEIMQNHFYNELQDDTSVLHMENVRGVSKNLFFINHKNDEDSSDDGMTSHSSKHEADMTVALCKYLMQQGYSPAQVTILTAYTGQIPSIKKQLNTDETVRVCVVDNFQGEESDIVLLSLVRSNQEGKIGFLQENNRICVMLSRARHGLFCIGNFNQLAAKSDKWKAITDEMREKQLLGDGLVLACSLHPDVETKVTCAADFTKVPEGGCMRPCEYRLPCGHVCTRACHPDDRSHEEFTCIKPCERLFCEANHKCPNVCGKPCPKVCERKVEKLLPGCKHSVTTECYRNPDYISCTEKCFKKLPCGHACRNACGKPCTEKPCMEQVLRTALPCGHQEYMPCSHGDSQCPALCRKPLACGHTCPGRCSSCHTGRLHLSCKQKCNRILVCGHTCHQSCASNCPPCTNPCETRCVHSACPNKCWEPCKPCQEPCSWQCSHFKCMKKCSEPCDRPQCNQPCHKVLKACRHKCIGMCGEPCPSKCRICHKEEVTEIFFGTEDDDDARFVELQDCGHIFEVHCLDRWMKQDDSSSPQSESGDGHGTAENEPSAVSVQLKFCPKCRTTIRRSTRYNRFINATLEDIERVKGQVIGSDQIESRKKEIKSMLRKIKESDHFKRVESVANKTMQSQTSLYDLNILLNQTNFISEVVELNKLLKGFSNESTWYKKTSLGISKIDDRLFNTARPFRGTEQELLDFPNELSRLRLCCEACSILKTGGLQLSQNSENIQSQIDAINVALFTDKPWAVENEEKIQKLLGNLREDVGGLGIDNETRIMIVKVMGLKKGHWYKCPKDHIYAIGECGGAMERGKCPECREEIGGAKHQLASGNVVASEMDGAEYASWSEQANMANYDLQD